MTQKIGRGTKRGTYGATFLSGMPLNFILIVSVLHGKGAWGTPFSVLQRQQGKRMIANPAA
jgi:hypothetical protein